MLPCASLCGRRRSVPPAWQEDPTSPGKPFTRHPYHVRVLVPCYKEGLDILRRTVMAAFDAALPEGCERTIYLLDDGKDAKKRKWVDSLGPGVVYVSGRRREPGEMNGKSGNLNNACAQLYPAGTPIPSTELLCIFDADQARARPPSRHKAARRPGALCSPVHRRWVPNRNSSRVCAKRNLHVLSHAASRACGVLACAHAAVATRASFADLRAVPV